MKNKILNTFREWLQATQPAKDAETNLKDLSKMSLARLRRLQKNFELE